MIPGSSFSKRIKSWFGNITWCSIIKSPFAKCYSLKIRFWKILNVLKSSFLVSILFFGYFRGVFCFYLFQPSNKHIYVWRRLVLRSLQNEAVEVTRHFSYIFPTIWGPTCWDFFQWSKNPIVSQSAFYTKDREIYSMEGLIVGYVDANT